MTELTNSIAQLNATLQEKSSIISRLQHEIHTTQESISSQHQQLEHHRARIAALEEKARLADTLSNEAEQQQEEVFQAKQDAKQAQADLADARTAIQEIQLSLVASKKEAQELESKLLELSTAHATLLEQQASTKAAYIQQDEIQRAQISQLQQNIQVIQSDCDATIAFARQRHESEIAVMLVQLDEEATAVSKLNKQHAELTHAMQQRIEELEASITESCARQEKLECETHAQVSTLQVENDELKNALTTLQQQCERATFEVRAEDSIQFYHFHTKFQSSQLKMDLAAATAADDSLHQQVRLSELR